MARDTAPVVAGRAPFFFVEEREPGRWEARFLGDVLRGTTCGNCGAHVSHATPAGVGATAEEAAQNASPREKAWVMGRDGAALIAAVLQYVPGVEPKREVVGAALAAIDRLKAEIADLREKLAEQA